MNPVEQFEAAKKLLLEKEAALVEELAQLRRLLGKSEKVNRYPEGARLAALRLYSEGSKTRVEMLKWFDANGYNHRSTEAIISRYFRVGANGELTPIERVNAIDKRTVLGRSRR